MPMFDRSGIEYIPVVSLSGENAAPELCGALFHVDALKAYNRALAATAAEEQSSVSEEINRNLTHIGDAANDLRELAGRVKGSGQALDNEVQVLERELGRLRT